MTTPLPPVSILIPTHNRPALFEIALKSALAQTYPHIQIVVSDNSDDDLTTALIQPYLALHNNIIYSHKKGTAVFENWQRCFDLSSGEYINFLMDDDFFHPQKIEIMMHYYLNEPDLGLVTSYRQVVDIDGNYLPINYSTQQLFTKDTRISGPSMGLKMLGEGTNFIGEPTSVLLRRSDVPYGLGHFCGKSYNLLVDAATWLNILKERDCIYIAGALSFFRLHDGQFQGQEGTKISSSIEWFDLLVDSYDNGFFFDNAVEFYKILSGKIEAFSSYMANNYPALPVDTAKRKEIMRVISEGYARLLGVK